MRFGLQAALKTLGVPVVRVCEVYSLEPSMRGLGPKGVHSAGLGVIGPHILVCASASKSQLCSC